MGFLFTWVTERWRRAVNNFGLQFVSSRFFRVNRVRFAGYEDALSVNNPVHNIMWSSCKKLIRCLQFIERTETADGE